MTQVTQEQYDKLDNIQGAFIDALVDKFDGDSEAAQAAYMKNVSLLSIPGIALAGIRLKNAADADVSTKAKRLVVWCDKAVPGLAKTFGEEALLKALPQEARNEEIAKLSEDLGGKRVADLVRKSMNLG